MKAVKMQTHSKGVPYSVNSYLNKLSLALILYNLLIKKFPSLLTQSLVFIRKYLKITFQQIVCPVKVVLFFQSFLHIYLEYLCDLIIQIYRNTLHKLILKQFLI